MEVVAPSAEAIAVLRAISHAGFAYAPSKALCKAAGWQLLDDEPGLGYIHYAMQVRPGAYQQRMLSVRIAEAEHQPWAFVPLFNFEEYDEGREPFDCAFCTLSEHLVGLLGAESRTGTYSYPHRPGWLYSFTGWALADTTLLLVQDELDIQFGMDVTLWVQPAHTTIEAPVRYE